MAHQQIWQPNAEVETAQDGPVPSDGEDPIVASFRMLQQQSAQQTAILERLLDRLD